MISVISTNITSPLGFTTEQNYQAVLAGTTRLQRYEHLWGLPEPFAASLFSQEQDAILAIEGHTRFESLAIRSVREALTHTTLDITSPRIILILSTTKGDIGTTPALTARHIQATLGLRHAPIVVCNACVSGLSAQLLADRLLSANLYDYAIVVGAEEQSKFIVSGFQSLKAVSDQPCRPFDIERNGLNPGEAAATIIYTKAAVLGCSSTKARLWSRKKREESKMSNFNGQCSMFNGWEREQTRTKFKGTDGWQLTSGAARGDAYHITSPSPKGDGLTAAIQQTLAGIDISHLATISMHGTATLYNDQMESSAIQRSGLTHIPLSALKGYYGHTMGAAGILETILTMRATEDRIVLPTKGYTELGVSGTLSISSQARPLQGQHMSFLKIMSGFGGCNVAVLYTKGAHHQPQVPEAAQLRETHRAKLTSRQGNTPIQIYNQHLLHYPKFYKMDILSQIALLASEILKKEGGLLTASEASKLSASNPAIILFNHSSSIVADRQYLSTISDDNAFFPSPSAFVYTLPNIAAGEVAIRHQFRGETSFYILPSKDETLMKQILDATIRTTHAQNIISGWIDAESETSFECELVAYEGLKIKDYEL